MFNVVAIIGGAIVFVAPSARTAVIIWAALHAWAASRSSPSRARLSSSWSSARAYCPTSRCATPARGASRHHGARDPRRGRRADQRRHQLVVRDPGPADGAIIVAQLRVPAHAGSPSASSASAVLYDGAHPPFARRREERSRVARRHARARAARRSCSYWCRRWWASRSSACHPSAPIYEHGPASVSTPRKRRRARSPGTSLKASPPMRPSRWWRPRSTRSGARGRCPSRAA